MVSCNRRHLCITLMVTKIKVRFKYIAVFLPIKVLLVQDSLLDNAKAYFYFL